MSSFKQFLIPAAVVTILLLWGSAMYYTVDSTHFSHGLISQETANHRCGDYAWRSDHSEAGNWVAEYTCHNGTRFPAYE